MGKYRPVTSSSDSRIGTPRGGTGQEISQLSDASWISTTWQEVGRQESCVVDSLHADIIGAERSFQSIPNLWANDGPLE